MLAAAESVAEAPGPRRKAGGAALGIGRPGFRWPPRPGPRWVGGLPPAGADTGPPRASRPHPPALASRNEGHGD